MAASAKFDYNSYKKMENEECHHIVGEGNG